MKSKRLLWGGIVASLVIVFLSSFLLRTWAQPKEKGPIKIGGIFDLTGFLAPLGADSQQGAILAFEKVGYKVAGRPIEFIREDGASNTDTTLDKARKLVEADKVCLIIGPIHSGAVLGMSGYLDRVNVPNLNIAYTPDALPLEHQSVWQVSGTLRQGTYASGVYAYEKLGYRTATTLAQDYVAGREFIEGFVQAFEERGGKVIQQQWYPAGTTDFTSYLINLKKADCLVPWFPGADAFAGFRQLKELKIKMPVIMPEDGGATTSPPAMKELGDSIIGIVVTAMYCYTADTPGNKEFVEAYKNKWNGAIPGPMSGAAFASTQVALEALRKAGGDTSPQALRKALSEVSLNTVRGPISFNKDRVALFTCFIVKVDKDLVPRVVGQYSVKGEKVGNKMVVGLVK
jgi:branched-chain amino acid transport system substrate-binding protein